VRGEFADVVITALLLAESMDIDTETALDEKVEAIEARYD
jgi:NTP pyrophosphatase (non-canonical NTP hydrolase)